jgi:hypothetical protein
VNHQSARPIGVSIFSIVNVVLGCFILLYWFALIAQGRAVSSPPPNSYVIFGAPLQAILSIICGFGLWELMEWARILVIFRSMFVICYQLFTTLTMTFPREPTIQIALVQILVSLSVCIYFVLPNVRKAFSKT